MKSAIRFARSKAILVTALSCALFAGSTAVSVTSATAGGAIPSGAGPCWPKTIAPSDFVREVTNPWFPLKPGSVWRYKGVKDGIKTTDVVTATHQKRRILGVATTVVHDVVSVNGKPEEVTDDFYAQDRHGNVWYFDEETEELNAIGEATSTEGSFEAGVEGARPGILIPGRPKVGVVGRQEFFAGEAEDHFKVLDLSAMVSVPFVSTDKALRTEEWTPLEPGVIDNKYYVHGVGTVREIAVKGPVEKLELVSYRVGCGGVQRARRSGCNPTATTGVAPSNASNPAGTVWAARIGDRLRFQPRGVSCHKLGSTSRSSSRR